VPKTTKAAPAPGKEAELSFEDALKQLEALVDEMESDALPLEDLLTHYEQGTRLAAVCQKKLAEAELKIQKLEKNAAGELGLKPFPLEEEAAEQET
jgi:exodeoxyribonuclease VII small subunit